MISLKDFNSRFPLKYFLYGYAWCSLDHLFLALFPWESNGAILRALSLWYWDYWCLRFYLPPNSSVVTCQGACSTLRFRSCLGFEVLADHSSWCSFPACPLCLRILNVLFSWSLYLLHHNFGFLNGVSCASNIILQPLGSFPLSLVFLRIHHCVAIYHMQLVYIVPLIIKHLRVDLFWDFLISDVLLFLPSLLWFGRGLDNKIDVLKNYFLAILFRFLFSNYNVTYWLYKVVCAPCH